MYIDKKDNTTQAVNTAFHINKGKGMPCIRPHTVSAIVSDQTHAYSVLWTLTFRAVFLALPAHHRDTTARLLHRLEAEKRQWERLARHQKCGTYFAGPV